jgi:hypothetical protein
MDAWSTELELENRNNNEMGVMVPVQSMSFKGFLLFWLFRVVPLL